ncbi:extracellular solute-binding protein [Streptomyces sp. NPDC048111]|uniref:extracellular solute-binding protein n=1 Tax=Streptomyces sp. NPDC048111 TaxID=3365500 RepID=UPI00370F96C3
MRPTAPGSRFRPRRTGARHRLPLILAAALAAGALAGCGGPGRDADTVRIAYNRSTDNTIRFKDAFLESVRKQFEQQHPGKKAELVPIQASDDDYATKVQQMMRSPKTAPDLVYEDTFRLSSDIGAGYLRPLDDLLAGWDQWSRFAGTAKAAARGADGRTYGVPDGTDTRGLWFNRQIFAKAGLPADWRPRTWAQVLDAARAVRRKVPGVVPLNVYTGRAAGEAAAMQGFEMLLYGTGPDPLYDPAAKSWVTGSRGFRDALDFVRTVYAEKLGPDPSDALDPNVGTRVATDWMPGGKLAIALDGSWLGQNWIDKGPRPWPAWSSTLGQAAMPTQYGQAPGRVSMSGGWTWAVPAKAANPGLAFDFVKTLQTKENAVKWDVADAQIAVRDDVAADPAYRRSTPGVTFFTGLVADTHYRPALAVYPRVSAAIGEAMESVTTGGAVADAAKAYDAHVTSLAEDAG